jgi:phosphoribosylglycinamide formyltransferase 1
VGADVADASRRIAVLISGRGSNLQALIDAVAMGRLEATIAVVISNRTDAPGLERARTAGIPAVTLPHRDYASRDAFEVALVAELQARDVALVCLAGFMRLLGPTFLAAFGERTLNVHPSLLPAFPGVDAQRQAFEHGVKVAGATVHFVDEGVDTGPIVLQAAVPVLDADTEATLSARILAEEHRLYPEAIRLYAEDRLVVSGRRVSVQPPADGRRPSLEIGRD